MSERDEEKCVELQLDQTDGIYKPVKVVRVKKQKVQAQSVKQPRTSRRQREIQRVADEIGSPELKQFLYGVNTAFDIYERFKKVFGQR